MPLTIGEANRIQDEVGSLVSLLNGAIAEGMNKGLRFEVDVRVHEIVDGEAVPRLDVLTFVDPRNIKEV
jgi:hypothetical protein